MRSFVMKGESTAKWLGIIVVLQVLTLIGQWASGPLSATPARAGIPDPGAQNNEIIEQLKGVNQRLDSLVAVLSSGNLQVKVAKSDDKGK
jgi:hypothetical protein